MSFTDHKITQFQHRIADLPDEPQLPAAELKSRFDACPEELRQSLNAVCDDAARLEARVEGIVVDTFGDTIDKEMLSDELAAELDGMADGIDALEESVAQKCEAYFGTYTGDGSGQQINLGFQPKAVIVIDPTSGNNTTQVINFCGMGLQGNPVTSRINITSTGFSINTPTSDSKSLCWRGHSYIYLAFK